MSYNRRHPVSWVIETEQSHDSDPIHHVKGIGSSYRTATTSSQQGTTLLACVDFNVSPLGSAQIPNETTIYLSIFGLMPRTNTCIGHPHKDWSPLA